MEAPHLSAPELFSRLRVSYWFIPLIVTLLGVALALVLLSVDVATDFKPTGAVGQVLPSSPEGARALLSAIISSMVTAISVTFSVTIVALTVAAQHFGPRVLNKFVRHTPAQVVLGTFIATFMYAVLVLSAVEGTEAAADVPILAVSGGIGLVILSMGALIYYVHYISTALQVGELAADVAEDFRTSLQSFYGADGDGQGSNSPLVPDPPEDVAAIPALESGYMQRVDYSALVELAARSDACVWIRREPGAFCVIGAPIALIAPPAACDDRFAAAVRRACVAGRDRTLWHDPEFAVKQLVEIALRALSPGINEPFTAMTCIDRLTDGWRPRFGPPCRARCGATATMSHACSHRRTHSRPCYGPPSTRFAFLPARIRRSTLV